MAKYIDADKLIAEIERRKKSIDECPFIEAEFGASIKRDVEIKTLNEIISVITSLQQEQPSLPSNLDEAAEEYVKMTSVKVWGEIDPQKDLKGYMARANYGVGLLDGFKVGAEWMARQMKQEQPEVDLEEEYKTWWNSISGKINVEHIMEWYMHETARHFYELRLKEKEGDK